ncbi:PhzF family phenazine biosynthesis protein [Alkalinema pantanalense CENA528]|uniref:PhzF family phenazine biosynthesis protein n=1 Tax=Alkalinema pantanalense TaxID=1620705 RepID=UPI003D6E4713
MSSLPFLIVDVFSEQKYAGNQLAVFLTDQSLSTERMQQLAREVNFSETTFVLSQAPRSGGYDVRIFTPTAELPFAGHPTLGTAYVIQQKLLQNQVPEVILNLAVGQIPVSLSYPESSNQSSTQQPTSPDQQPTSPDQPNILWMRQNSPEFGEQKTIAEIAPIIGLTEADFDDRYPIQMVSTGLPFLIVPLKTLDALQRIRVNRDHYQTLVQQGIPAIFVFCPETRNPAHQFSARMFAEAWGIPEDPATGSANGCFAGYLAQYRYLGSDRVDVQVEQGYEMGRPALLHLRATRSQEQIEVLVGGKVILVAQGEFV